MLLLPPLLPPALPFFAYPSLLTFDENRLSDEYAIPNPLSSSEFGVEFELERKNYKIAYV